MAGALCRGAAGALWRRFHSRQDDHRRAAAPAGHLGPGQPVGGGRHQLAPRPAPRPLDALAGPARQDANVPAIGRPGVPAASHRRVRGVLVGRCSAGLGRSIARSITGGSAPLGRPVRSGLVTESGPGPARPLGSVVFDLDREASAVGTGALTLDGCQRGSHRHGLRPPVSAPVPEGSLRKSVMTMVLAASPTPVVRLIVVGSVMA